jgi:thiamine-phosphate pyrophosphorylase
MAETPRLYLITPPLADAAAFAPALEAAMAAADVACVLVRTAARDESAVKAAVKVLAPIVQGRGAALLVEGSDPRLAVRADADGLHVAGGTPALFEAVEALHPKKIVGAGHLAGRDEAMLSGEAGADYLLFGGPDEPHEQDAILERVAWWADIFNVPCVGYAVSPADAGAVARAGAEFVALCGGLWDAPDGVAAILHQVEADLADGVAREAAPA